MRDALQAFREQRWEDAARGLEPVVRRTPDPNLLTLLGIAMLNLGRLDAAALHLQQAILRNPEQVDARFHLGLVAFAKRDLDTAETHLRAVMQRRPNHRAAQRQLALCLSEAGDVPQAVAAWRTLARMVPEDPEPWLGVAQGLAMLGRPDAAILAAEQAERCSAQDPEVLARLGMLLVERGRLEEAEPKLRAAGDHPEARIARATIALRRGRLDEVETLIGDEAPERLPPHGFEIWAAAAARRGDANFACRKADIMLQNEWSTEERVLLLHVRADLHDRLGRGEAAFADWRAANQLRPSHFDPVQNAAAVDARIRAHREPLPLGSVPPSSAPVVLIVGMPRSGSSLLEQMLDRHPLLAGLGELRHLHDAVEQLPGYPHRASDLAAAAYHAAGRQYCSRLPPRPGQLRIDKMPHNFLNLGAAALMLPGLRVLHMVRDPLDVCFSCYRQRFRDGMSYTTRLDWLGSFHRDYSRLMSHWRGILPAGVLHDVRYRDLVVQPERTLRDVLSFLGLDFDPRCLAPERNRRGVATASRDEVTQSVHTNSLARAQAYRPQLGALINSLTNPFPQG